MSSSPRKSRRRISCAGRRRRGTALVEFALVIPVVLTMLIGIMEFGILVRNNLTLANAAREGARSASLGTRLADIRTRVKNAAVPLPVTDDTITIEQSADGTTYTAMSDNASENSATVGQMCRVRVTAQHRQLTGFFPFLRNRTIGANAAFRRE